MKVIYADVTGQTTYGLVQRLDDGFFWRTDTTVFEDYVAGNYANYDVAGAEYGTSGIYRITFPPGITGAGGYQVMFKRQAGGSPAQSDPIIWEKEVWWNGADVTPAPPPSATPGQVTGYIYTYDEDGVIETGVTIKCYAKDITADTEDLADIQYGFALDTATRTVVSDGAGLAEFPNLFKGVTYAFWRGTDETGRVFNVTIPADAADPYELPSLLGIP